MQHRGFTLVELLVVIAIIGTLASVVLGSLATARAKGRDAKRLTDLQQMVRTIAVADTGSGATFAGSAGVCGGATNQVNARSCTTLPNLSGFKDPSGSGSPCSGIPSTSCDYGLSNWAGGGGANFNDWVICAYLEAGTGTFSAGGVYVSNATATPSQLDTPGCRP